ncbi:MAG: hypothetical protein RBS36_04335 [Thiomicrospira sp.]|jgi:hypothetical protein|nr:hypothetical protein [Thiomicrospira sp.]
MRITPEYIAMLVKKTGLNKATVRSRVAAGWTEQRILETPLNTAISRASQKPKKTAAPPPPPPSEYAALTPKLTPLARYFCGLALKE